MMTTMGRRLKRSDVLIGIVHAVRHFERVVYIKATTRKSTTRVPIGKVRFETYQLVWYLVTQIVQGNLNVHK